MSPKNIPPGADADIVDSPITLISPVKSALEHVNSPDALIEPSTLSTGCPSCYGDPLITSPPLVDPVMDTFTPSCGFTLFTLSLLILFSLSYVLVLVVTNIY